MAENKTKPTTVSAARFIASVADARQRRDCRALAALMRDVTGTPARMWGASIVGFDQYHYRYDSGREGDAPLTGFAPRARGLVLYLGPGLDEAALLDRLGRHKVGKGCLYLATLDDVDRSVLRRLVTASVSAMRRRYPRARARA